MILFSFEAQSALVEQAINENYSLLSENTYSVHKLSSGPLNLDVRFHQRSIGVAKNYRYGESFRTSLGLLIADDYMRVSSTESTLSFAGRTLDLNQLLGVKANIDFHPVIPYASFAYRYKSPGSNLSFELMTGIKLLKLDKVHISFYQPLGDLIEENPESAAQFKQDAFGKLDDYYLLPVFSTKLQYLF